MPSGWVNLPIDRKLFQNVHETALTEAQARLENCFQNKAGGSSRFPGLSDFVELSDQGRVYVHAWRGDMILATSRGRVYRVDRDGNREDVTGVPVSGGKRVIFAATEDRLVMAAGGPIIEFDGETTRVLSENAPNATFVAFIDTYLIANEANSGRWYHSEAGVYDSWSALDVFVADTKPDPITAIIVTKFREIMICGDQSIEQYERLASGTAPFFRRWGVGEDISVPYSLIFADNGVWGVNTQSEFVRMSGQTAEPRSDDIGRSLEAIDDWTDAWVGGYPDKPLHILGQKFIVLQAPEATNTYGTKGVTLVYDYRQQRWYSLYGWDAEHGVPARWPGWSVYPVWGNYYVGGEGKVYKLDTENFDHAGGVQRMLGRTAPYTKLGTVRIDRLRGKFRRGVGSYTAAPSFWLRCRRDNKAWGRWVKRDLGLTGERDFFVPFGGFGIGDSFQFEWMATDNAPVDLLGLQVQVTQMAQR